MSCQVGGRLQCPNCGYERTEVVDTRETKLHVRRRRLCLKCNKKFTTREMRSEVQVQVQTKVPPLPRKIIQSSIPEHKPNPFESITKKLENDLGEIS